MTWNENNVAGVYKNWPSGDDAMIVDITRVAEMRVLQRTKVGAHARLAYEHENKTPLEKLRDSCHVFSRHDRHSSTALRTKVLMILKHWACGYRRAACGYAKYEIIRRVVPITKVSLRLFLSGLLSFICFLSATLGQKIVSAQEGGLLIGAAVTQEELIDCLLSSCSAEDGPAKNSTRASGRHLPHDCPNGQPTQLPSCPNGQPEQPQPNR